MEMLHECYEECLDTLSAERMAFEATFRHTDSDGTEWIYHFSLYGEDSAGLDLSNPVDQEHLAYAKRCKEPGWDELRPVLMLAFRPVLEAWGREGWLTGRVRVPSVGGPRSRSFSTQLGRTRWGPPVPTRRPSRPRPHPAASPAANLCP